ncbi:hypothetical protein XELAEV_18006050mg [Xenopus laevis]|uniref:Uncharacterized protein n=1 Tax=Xenopus laevis TaxID=8355 RepID=A0A974E0F3_XENLA|nr:hypothetical protein XELAEV_18006050mg [Xenopus laevis]
MLRPFTVQNCTGDNKVPKNKLNLVKSIPARSLLSVLRGAIGLQFSTCFGSFPFDSKIKEDSLIDGAKIPPSRQSLKTSMRTGASCKVIWS